MNFTNHSVLQNFGNKMLKKKLGFAIFFLLTVFTSVAQTKIQGSIKDIHGVPIAGVSIIEKNTSNHGVLSDFDGNFQMTIQKPNSKLVVSYVGFITQEVTVSNNKVEVVLLESVEQLSDVVVVGYGTQKKSRVTSAIASIKEKDFTRGAIRDASDLIKGKVAGLTISTGSGDPSAAPNISLRGVSSLKGSTTPLVLINGVPGGIDTVSPNEIASIDVLKDASAAAIYGTRGANGVILITTKTVNKEMQPTMTYSTFTTVSNFAKKADF